MRPTNIDDNDVWTGGERISVGPPEGSEDYVEPVEAVVDIVETPHGAMRRFNVKCEMTPEDAQRLCFTGATIWVSFISGVVPFQVRVGSPGEDLREQESQGQESQEQNGGSGE